MCETKAVFLPSTYARRAFWHLVQTINHASSIIPTFSPLLVFHSIDSRLYTQVSCSNERS